jgi:hypothetical protein
MRYAQRLWMQAQMAGNIIPLQFKTALPKVSIDRERFLELVLACFEGPV